MQEDKVLEEFSVVEVKQWLKSKSFMDETVKKFEEQKIDGEALVYLAKHGSAQQWEQLGIKTVGEQLNFKGTVLGIITKTSRKKSKPRKADLLKMSPLNQRIYKTKRSAVRTAAIKKWPGNDIPTFKKTSRALKELHELVDQLEEECTFERAGFNREGIKKHILDVLNERRRHMRNGHDYSKEDKRKTKKRTESDTDCSSSTASTEILSGSQSDEDLSGREDKETPLESILETESDDNEADFGDDDDDVPLTQVSKGKPTGDEEDVPADAARIIMQVAFNALQFKDVSKKQLMSYVKKYKLHLNPTTLDKTVCAQLLAKYCMQEGYINVECKLVQIDRAKVHKLKAF